MWESSQRLGIRPWFFIPWFSPSLTTGYVQLSLNIAEKIDNNWNSKYDSWVDTDLMSHDLCIHIASPRRHSLPSIGWLSCRNYRRPVARRTWGAPTPPATLDPRVCKQKAQSVLHCKTWSKDQLALKTTDTLAPRVRKKNTHTQPPPQI